MLSRVQRHFLLTPLLASSFGALASCAPSLATPDNAIADQEPSGWVVVTYEDRPMEFDGDLMEALLETELAADQALADANAGWIDGNGIGDSTYDLYFVGADPAVMWDVLEPVFAAAPVAWTRVELHDGLEDPNPTVIEGD